MSSLAFPLDDHGMNSGRTDQPGHKRCVLHRVPGPVSSERERLVGPVSAKKYGSQQTEVCTEGPGKCRPYPFVVFPGPQRGYRKGERNCHEGEAKENNRRMNHHPWTFQKVIQPGAIGWCEIGIRLNEGGIRDLLDLRRKGLDSSHVARASVV